MLLGFISLLLTVLQNTIVKICVHEDVMRHLLPCSYSAKEGETTTMLRRLLAEKSAGGGYCTRKVIESIFSSLLFCVLKPIIHHILYQ